MNTALRTVFALAAFVFCGNLAEAGTGQILESYGKIPLAFTVNEGQLDGYDGNEAIAMDNSGDTPVAGHTTASDYLVTSGAVDAAPGRFGDGFVTKPPLPSASPIMVNYPNGGETVPAGTTQTITWTSTLFSTADIETPLKIELLRNSGMFRQMIVASTRDTGSYTWTIPTDLPDSGDYRIRISVVADSTVGDQSDANFTIARTVASPRTPTAFSVSRPYPNPFNLSTSIAVQLPDSVHVSAIMYDALGREVRLLYYGRMSAGLHTLVWDGRNNAGMTVASGVYFYTVQVGTYSAKGKVMSLR